MAATHPYAGMSYAGTMAHLGRPFWVAPWRNAMLLREAPGGALDAAAPYPLGVLEERAELAAGMGVLREAGAVSVVLVADPFAAPSPDWLRRGFSRVVPFKTHWAVERAAGAFAPTAHHRQRIRIAGRRCRIRRARLRDHLEDWCRLYADLSRRHGITGLHAFPRACFEGLAGIEGLHAFVAESLTGEVIAMHLWMDDGRTAYSHLAATSAAGYAAKAPFGLYAAAIEHFAAREAIDLGGGAGLADRADDGLAQFKRGFANAARMAHLCGEVLDEAAYALLSAGRDTTGYFPAYRAPSAVKGGSTPASCTVEARGGG
ncbi:Acetyltransferase (GNAT) domain-containing protein [Roseomonas rosea]|uniref:Acetyltransferase (GNAT) domain-containing protein n=1 Tax=Muricoccus roseus TaxID=198092 RepID=A0A1M6GUI6_9PROT|nr:GNAT family N-acetyltransferase [Roseomonas rosea]SHJ13564.1 Acetyltransferase (GNAT) domain-containing protein [Roseomonas rosea]